jgi:hypothetical protein
MTTASAGPTKEAQPPAQSRADPVQERQRHQDADDRPGPVGAVDADVDPTPVHSRVISSMAELIAAYSPPIPVPAMNRQPLAEQHRQPAVTGVTGCSWRCRLPRASTRRISPGARRSGGGPVRGAVTASSSSGDVPALTIRRDSPGRTGAGPGRLPGRRQVAAGHGADPGLRIAAGRAAGQLIVRALADRGVHGPRGGRMKAAGLTSFLSASAA